MRKYLKEKPKPNPFLTLTKVLVVAEVAFAAVAYHYWRNMNRSREYRYKMYNNFPFVLNCFYKTGETFGKLKTRQEDYEAWGVQEKLS